MDYKEKYESEDERIRKALVDALKKNLGNGIEKYGTTLDAALDWLEKQGEQKPAEWSEEDTIIINELIAFLENGEVKLQHDLSLYAKWLKAIKDRVQPKQDWSVEDRSKIQRICKYLDEAKKYYADITEVRECIDWLKSLRPQKQWKPTEEHLLALEHFVRSVGASGYASPYDILQESPRTSVVGVCQFR